MDIELAIGIVVLMGLILVLRVWRLSRLEPSTNDWHGHGIDARPIGRGVREARRDPIGRLRDRRPSEAQRQRLAAVYRRMASLAYFRGSQPLRTDAQNGYNLPP